MKKRSIFLFFAILLSLLPLAACGKPAALPWTSVASNDKTVYQFSDGTGIATPSGAAVKTSFTDAQNGKITFTGSTVTILFANGVIVSAPVNTSVSVVNGVCTVTVGDGEATVTRTNGLAVVVPAGAVLDNEGNF